MPDEKLKTAMEEIKGVLKKYDIGAAVVLASETHMEYLNEITPTWSCCWFEKLPDGTLGLRIRSQREDYPSLAAQKKCTEDTVGMIMGFADAQIAMHEMMLSAAAQIGKVLPFDHSTRDEK